jgi:hypothetical protein
MKYCILWGLTFGIATFFQIEKPFQVHTGYVSSTEACAPKYFMAEVKCFNIILNFKGSTSFSDAEAEIRIININNTRILKVSFNRPGFIITGENLFLFPAALQR